MLQCSQCEYFVRGPGGQFRFTCDPFSTIKEPECLIKWQLVKLESLVQAYQATLGFYQRLAPMQERLFRHMERELREAEEADSWKQSLEDDDLPPADDDGDDDDPDPRR